MITNASRAGINLDSNKSDNVSILKLGIINIQGRLIKSQRIERNPQTLDVSDFPDGIYVLRFYTENGIATKKLIKQ